MAQVHQVIIIGSGFGGQIAAINLQKKGIKDFIILERRAFVGGTWSQNTYPGAAVDVHSPLYSISSEPYDWSQMFAEQDELRQYTNHVIDKHGLREKTQVNTNVSKVAWNDEQTLWEIYTDANDAPLRCTFLINASGPLSTPVIPNFKGRDTFKGASFHTNNWDHSYDYKGKKVAIIGSGASAAQVIPAIAPEVEELHIFQRTPHWVMPRPDHTFSKWQRALLRNKWVYKFLRVLIYWVLESRVVGFKYSKTMLDVLGTRGAKNNLKKQFPPPSQKNPEYVLNYE